MNLIAERHSVSVPGRLAHLWPLLYVIFLPNLAPPLTAVFKAHPSAWRLTLVVGGTALFVTLYLWAAWHNDMSRAVYPAPAPRQSWRRQWAPVVVLAGLSVALILGAGSPWLCLLIFTSAIAGGRLPLRPAILTVTGLTLLTALLGRFTGDALSDLGQAAFWTGMSGALTIIMNYLRSTNRAVRMAREEITRLAVEAERLRFARDLHDLLGHDLARIALQSELAEALAPTAPDQAISVMHDVGNVARQALREVRATVAGYRRPTLIGESRAAGEILAAAGIAYRCEGERIEVAPEVEAVLAWAVREGTTNVVRHSHADRCDIRIQASDGLA
ncbi:MAG: sensor histidine kinase, partial [Chloroflexota bacterium]